MAQLSLLNDSTNLFELLCHEQTLKAALKSVKANNSSPGIDGVTVSDFTKRKDQELAQLREDLINWCYQPMPVRRVEIPKPGSDGLRLLGVPCVRDRVVHTAIKLVIEPILEPTFSNSSYGFRPKRNQRQAIEAARQYVEAGKEYVVDIDLSKFFDRINHDRLIAKLSKLIDDKRILRLIGMTLRSGILTDQGYIASTIGSTQGSPLSPLLSNVILDELDKKLEQRGLCFVRYADDCNIFTATVKSATRVMGATCRFIETKMKLIVNREKSQVAKSNRVKFLGVTIVKNTIAVSKNALKAAKEKVKQLIPRGSHKTLEETVQDFNRWYLGWAGYFNVTYYPSQLKSIEAYARRRLRARIISQSKRRLFLFRKLKKHGVKHKTAAKAAFSNQRRWALSKSRAVERAFSNKYFERVGMLVKSNQRLKHWVDVNQWVYLS